MFSKIFIPRVHPVICGLAMTLVLASWFAAEGRAENRPTIEPSYVARNGDAYIYEKVPHGDATEPEYALVWYLGKQPNTNGPLIRYQDGSMLVTLECDDSCEYVKWTTAEGQVESSGTIRVINDPLVHSIVRDATSGLLD